MLVFFLARFGIVTAGFLAKDKIRHPHHLYRRGRDYALPDIASQFIFAAPMLAHAISIGVAWIFGKKRARFEA